jgi:acetyl esterase
VSLRARVRKKAGAKVVEGFFRGLSAAGRMHPKARPSAHGLERLNDIPYLDTGMKEHLLDVYRPQHRNGPLPAVLYVHGGGFRILSKETHWLMGLMFARRDMVVFSINYRLAPKYPFPAAHQDVFKAYQWVVENAHEYGADPSRLVFAGESAGANLVTSLALALSVDRPEPWAEEVFAKNVQPHAVLPACGLFQVSEPERFRPEAPSRIIFDRILEVSHGYLPDELPLEERLLADPLLWFERGEAPARPLPPFFLPVGLKDPIWGDTKRLAQALAKLDVPHEAKYYEGEIHAFHALFWREQAKECWRDHYRFLDRYVA